MAIYKPHFFRQNMFNIKSIFSRDVVIYELHFSTQNIVLNKLHIFLDKIWLTINCSLFLEKYTLHIFPDNITFKTNNLEKGMNPSFHLISYE